MTVVCFGLLEYTVNRKMRDHVQISGSRPDEQIRRFIDIQLGRVTGSSSDRTVQNNHAQKYCPPDPPGSLLQKRHSPADCQHSTAAPCHSPLPFSVKINCRTPIYHLRFSFISFDVSTRRRVHFTPRARQSPPGHRRLCPQLPDRLKACLRNCSSLFDRHHWVRS